MMADLEALAETCPQQRLIEFLRAAAFVSEVPAGLAEPGARMEAGVVRELKVRLAFASRAIAELPLYLQNDLLPRGGDSVSRRLGSILNHALAGRAVAEVISDGEKVERAFLPKLRAHLIHELQAEMEGSRGETSQQDDVAPQRQSGEAQRLRGFIERIDRRLAMLETEAPAPPPAGAD
jgi:hypothetical protein